MAASGLLGRKKTWKQNDQNGQKSPSMTDDRDKKTGFSETND
jgi:hypothetical protein